MGWIRRLSVALCVLLLMFGFLSPLKAQTWGEFFRQKKTQKKYLLTQIAALQVFIGQARKGYELVGNGLQTVKDMANGEFRLHEAFISSLKQVSPAVQADVRIAEMISMQLSVLRRSGSWTDHELLSTANRVYISGVRANLRSACLDLVEQLLLVVGSGRLELGDQERLRRIGELYQSMQEHYSFANAFTVEVEMLVRSRERELKQLQQIEKNYEDNN